MRPFQVSQTFQLKKKLEGKILKLDTQKKLSGDLTCFNQIKNVNYNLRAV